MAYEKILNSWAEFEEEVGKFPMGSIGGPSYIFRGHSDGKWGISSSFNRCSLGNNIDTAALLEIEEESVTEFKKEAHRFIHPNLFQKMVTKMDWLAVMQHHGVPTRLLDWTASPYVSAYFACIDHPNLSGAIWALQQDSLREKMEGVHKDSSTPGSNQLDENVIFDKNAPHVITTVVCWHQTDRMIAQQGGFSYCMNLGVEQHKVLSETLSSTQENPEFF